MAQFLGKSKDLMAVTQLARSLSSLRVGFVSNTSAATFSSYRKICKDLNIPEPPKIPLGRFMKFRVEQIVKGTAHSNIAQLWRNLSEDERQRYDKDRAEQLALYRTQMSQYHLTTSQRLAIASEKLNIADEKQQRSDERKHKVQCQLLNKPKHPTTVFGTFLSKSMKNSKECSVLWRNMSTADKQPYFDLHKQHHEQYKRELAEWEEKMLAEGHKDLISIPNGSKASKSLRQLCKELDIPEPPQRPLNSFIRFRIEQAAKGVPGSTYKWRDLNESQRQKYYVDSAEAMTIYKNQMTQYQHQLTTAQRRKIEVERANIAHFKEQYDIQQKYKATCRQLNKPTRPGPVLTIFSVESKLTVIEARAKWQSMSDAQKKPYKELYSQQIERFRRELVEWEYLMIASGRRDMVRKQTLAAEKRKRKQAKTDKWEKAQ